MNQTAQTSFGRKLLGAFVVVSTLAVILVCGTFAALENSSLIDQAVREARGQAELLAANATASVEFDDAEAATEILNTLRVNKHVLAADIHLPDGTAFAEYSAPGTRSHRDHAVGHATGDSNVILPDQIIVAAPIMSGATTLATLDVHFDRTPAREAVKQATMTSLLVGAMAIGLAAIVSWNLQLRLLRPIRELSRVAADVAGSNDYTARAMVYSRDELGRLTETFNGMLGRVEQHERSLAEVNQQLEARVAERTADLTRALETAEAANRSKSAFLANMSHEIRTPMTAILGFGDLLLDPELAAAERMDHVQTIRRSGQHLLTIINDILDLSKIEAGRMEIAHSRCSPVQIAVEITSLMRPRAIEKGLTLSVDFVGAIPDRIDSDPIRLRQIVLNLVGNAVKFTTSGQVTLRLSCDMQSRLIHYDVIDTGIGISDEALARLFRPFAQADETMTRRFGGTGLGLAISRQLAQLMGGDITVTSREGAGSTFRCTVGTGDLQGSALLEGITEAELGDPDETDRPHGASSPAAPGAVDAAMLAAHPHRLLLAEDGPDNQRLITFILRRAGYEVDLAENGRIAVERVFAAIESGRPYGLVLMDMQMPEMDGYTATETLRERGVETPIIALTAHAMQGDRERCINAGCSDYTTKPIDRVRLLTMVAQWAREVALTRAARMKDEG